MLICAAGDIHGAIDRMYDEIFALEATVGASFDCVVQVGDFGILPDPHRLDKATRKHDGAGDFARWYAERRPVPRKTIFIKGNHEDFDWLDEQPGDEILPGLHYLRNGRTIDLRVGDDVVRVGGVGGCYAPSDYPRKSKTLVGSEKAHYTHDEVASLSMDLDILLLHDAPSGVRFAAGYTSMAEGFDELLRRTRPAVCIFGHHHTRLDVKVPGAGVCMGLNLIGHAGNLVAFEFSRRSAFEKRGER